jgi:ribonuclease HI
MTDYILYSDGGARGNPGIAGSGAVVCNAKGEILQENFKSLGIGTNNEAEYQGVILALTTLQAYLKGETKQQKIELRLDSELVAKQLRGEYKVKEERLKKLHQETKQLISELGIELTIVHVRREQNKDADRLSNEAMDQGVV